MQYLRIGLLFCLAIGVSACSSTSNHHSMMVLVAPAEVNYKVELTLLKLTEYINSDQIRPAQKAQFLYDRGVLYDSVGLKTLARIDFHQAIKLKPNMADAYNFLGIYYTQDEAYERAYEAFEAVLELQPNYEYAYFNRGLAAYYQERMPIAFDDFDAFYQLKPKDGYRMLWLYIAKSEVSPTEARSELLEKRARLDDYLWDSKLIDLMLGRISEEQIFIDSSVQLTYRNEMAERMCEVYFYAGKQAQIEGRHHAAMSYFKLALSTNVYDFVEHRYARMELYKSLKEL